MTTSGFLLGLPRADTLPGQPAYPSPQPCPEILIFQPSNE